MPHDRDQPYERAVAPRIRTARRGLAWAVAVLLGLLSLAGCTDSGVAPADPVQLFVAQERRPAPELTGELLDGSGTYDPATYGGHVLVINFWASWCSPCVGEAPELEAVYEEHREAGVVFLGINVNDQLDSARAFARQHTTFPSIFDPSSRLALGFNVHPRTIPSTIVLDRQGRVAAVAHQAVVRTELDAVVVALLEEVPAPGASQRATASEERTLGAGARSTG